ncbi:MAG: serpin family protein, partial [Nitrosopumilaceae archaeon]
LEEGSTDELTRLIITNAIYFNGEWTYPFSPDWTRESDFHTSKDKTVKVSMMDLNVRELNYTQNQLLEILELPYKGEKISMLILLPKEIEGLESVEEVLTADKLSQWRENLSETHIAVLLPKFTAETKYDLKDSLQNMGMNIPFDEFNADFSGINETERLYIDQAVHKAFVNVYELGTEAAAATGLEVRATSGPPATFAADHPFIFIIQDTQTGNILFMGKVVDPTQ